MATPRQERILEQLKPAILKLASIQVDSLVQKDRLGSELSFEPARELFEDLLQLTSQLSGVDFRRAPYPAVQQLLNAVNQVTQQLDSIAKFPPENGSAARMALVQQLEDAWSGLLSAAAPVLAVIGARAAEQIDAKTAKLDSALITSHEAAEQIRAKEDEIGRRLDLFVQEKGQEFERAGEAKLKAVEAALESVRSLAAVAGVSQHARYFEEEVAVFRSQSRVWLAVLIATVSILLLYAVAGAVLLEGWGLAPPLTGAFAIDIIRLFTQRALLAFGLIFAVIWAARNYSAARHNEVINRHRRNSLGSFETFVQSASDDATKNAVLIQAAQSIFSPQQTGFVKSDGDSSGSSHVVELVRGLSPGKSDK